MAVCVKSYAHNIVATISHNAFVIAEVFGLRYSCFIAVRQLSCCVCLLLCQHIELSHFSFRLIAKRIGHDNAFSILHLIESMLAA